MLRDSNKRIIWLITGAVILFFLIILGSVFLGIRSITTIVLFVVGALIFLGLIGVVIYVVYYIWFKKHKFDATYMNKKNLVSAGKISKPQNINDLYLSGDAGHSRVRVGKIIGYCRIQTIRKTTDYDENTGKPKMLPDKQRKGLYHEKSVIEKQEQDVFVIQTSGWLGSLFEEPAVVRCEPEDHDELVGDVTLWGFSLIPVSEYYYLNKEHIDVQSIDQSILMEAKRTIYFEALKDTKEIVDRATGLDAQHKKAIESKNLYDIPNMPTQPGGGNQ